MLTPKKFSFQCWVILQIFGMSKQTLSSSAEQEVFVKVGQIAVFTCHNENNYTVYWIRKRDNIILPGGRYTYVDDQRFQSFQKPGADSWVLCLKYAQIQDSGGYECQLRDDGGNTVSTPYNLTVQLPKADILEGPALFFKEGEDLLLSCSSRNASILNSPYVWFHGPQNMSSSNKVNMTIDQSKGLSYLHIKKVKPSDSGNYTCAPVSLSPTSITVHVAESDVKHNTNFLNFILHILLLL